MDVSYNFRAVCIGTQFRAQPKYNVIVGQNSLFIIGLGATVLGVNICKGDTN
jgi:hypothetical protein